MIPEFVRIWTTVVASLTGVFITAFVTVFYAIKTVESNTLRPRKYLEELISLFMENALKLMECRGIADKLKDKVYKTEFKDITDCCFYDTFIKYYFSIIEVAWYVGVERPIFKLIRPISDDVLALRVYVDTEQHRRILVEEPDGDRSTCLRFLMKHLDQSILDNVKASYNELTNLLNWHKQLKGFYNTYIKILTVFIISILLMVISSILFVHNQALYSYLISGTICFSLTVGATLSIVAIFMNRLIHKYGEEGDSSNLMPRHPAIWIIIGVIAGIALFSLYLFSFVFPNSPTLFRNSQETLADSIKQLPSGINKSMDSLNQQIGGLANNIKEGDKSIKSLENKISLIDKELKDLNEGNRELKSILSQRVTKYKKK